MKKIILLTSILFFSSVFATKVSDWTIINIDGKSWLSSKSNKDLKAVITKRTGENKVTEVRPVGNDYELIIYYSGAAGTYHMIDIYYAIIFNKKNNKFIGDYPYKYRSQQGKKVTNPKWDITDKEITITDAQTDLHKVVSLESN